MNDHTPVTPSLCPQCGYLSNHAGSLNGGPVEAPSPGDLCVCLRCGEILQLGPDMRLARISSAEWEAFAEEQPGDAIALLDFQLKARAAAAMYGPLPSRGGRA